MLLSTIASPLKRLIEKPTETVIQPGDYVRYWDHVEQVEKVGVYVNLWYYISNKTETSPFPMNDALCEWTVGRENHVPIYHAYIQSGTDNNPSTFYANIDSVEPATYTDWLRFHLEVAEGQVA